MLLSQAYRYSLRLDLKASEILLDFIQMVERGELELDADRLPTQKHIEYQVLSAKWAKTPDRICWTSSTAWTSRILCWNPKELMASGMDNGVLNLLISLQPDASLNNPHVLCQMFHLYELHVNCLPDLEVKIAEFLLLLWILKSGAESLLLAFYDERWPIHTS